MAKSWQLSVVGALICACGVGGNAAGTAASEDAVNGGGGPSMPRPPQEAIDACASVAVDGVCSFSVDGHQVTGTCRQGPPGAPAACAPSQGPGPGDQRGPPPEAFEACRTLTDGAACTVSFNGTSLSGVCRFGPEAARGLACVPPNMGPRPPPREAIEACANLAVDAACSFSFDGHALSGACRQGPPGAPAACAPPPPREAVDACAGLSDGARCTFTFDGRALEGSCVSPPGASVLACLPAGPG